MGLSRRAWAAVFLVTVACHPRPQLPALPSLVVDGLLPAVAEQLRTSDQQARENPRDATANGRLGMTLHAYQRYDAAITCYERARLLEPKAFRWTYLQGIAQAEAARPEAVATLENAVQLQPDYIPARLKLAELLSNRGELNRSRGLYEDLVRRDGRSAEAQLGLGRVLAAQGDSRAALEHLQLATTLAPNYGAAHYALALAHRSLGDFTAADRHFVLHEQNRLIRPPLNDPLAADVQALDVGAVLRARRAMALAGAGQLTEAAAEFERVLQTDPQYAPAHANLIALYWKLGAFDKAEEHYRKAVEISPNSPEPYLNYALLMSQQGRFPEAEKAFRKTLEVQPSSAEARTQYGLVLEKQGKTEAAEKQYELALGSEPNHRQANFLYGRRLIERGRYALAIEHLRKTLVPDDERAAWYMRVLSGAYARSGDRLSAVYYAQEAKKRATARGMRDLALRLAKDLRTLHGP